MTQSSIYQKVIEEAIAEKSKMNIDEIYSAISENVDFKEADLEVTTIKGRATNEPSWKRNARNVLQRLKENGVLVNSPKNWWRQPQQDPTTAIPFENSWEEILASANRHFESKEEWHSPKRERRYTVTKILKNEIHIERLDAKGHTSIKKTEVEKAIKILNAAGGQVERTTIRTVAKEATIVHFHPLLDWDESKQYETVAQIKSKGF